MYHVQCWEWWVTWSVRETKYCSENRDLVNQNASWWEQVFVSSKSWYFSVIYKFFNYCLQGTVVEKWILACKWKMSIPKRQTKSDWTRQLSHEKSSNCLMLACNYTCSWFGLMIMMLCCSTKKDQVKSGKNLLYYFKIFNTKNIISVDVIKLFWISVRPWIDFFSQSRYTVLYYTIHFMRSGSWRSVRLKNTSA